MSRLDYYKESIADNLCDFGISIDEVQLSEFAENIITSIEMENEVCCGYVGSNENSRIEELERELEKERGKKICPECKGLGRITIQGPYHSSNSECTTCRGEGKV